MKKLALCLIACALSLPTLSGVVGVERLNFFRYYGITSGGEFRGYAYQFLSSLHTCTGQKKIELSYRSAPTKRLFEHYWNGVFKIKFPDNPNWFAKKRKEFETKNKVKIIYSKPLTTAIEGMVVLKNHAKTPLKDLKIIGTLRGFDIGEYQNYVDSGALKLKLYNSTHDIAQALSSGEISGAFYNQEVLDLAISAFFPSEKGKILLREDLPKVNAEFAIGGYGKEAEALITQVDNCIKKKQETEIDLPLDDL